MILEKPKELTDDLHSLRLQRNEELKHGNDEAGSMFMAALKKLAKAGNIPSANIQIFEDQIRGKRNG